VVAFFTKLFHTKEGHVLNVAAIFFMVGSFMFSFGSYVNALSIFEGPRTFRKHLLSCTTLYMFGGLFFIAGTMGYVHAFLPNEVSTLQKAAAAVAAFSNNIEAVEHAASVLLEEAKAAKALMLFSTFFYLIGCCCYVGGSLIAFVSLVARQQVQWERVQEQKQRKQRKMASVVGRASTALPRALIKKMKRKKASSSSAEDSTSRADLDLDLEDSYSVEADDAPEFGDIHSIDDLDLELDESGLSGLDEKLDKIQQEEDIFGAFWRSVTGTGAAAVADAAATVDEPTRDRTMAPADAAAGIPESQKKSRDNVPFMQAREN
jgi:hypothetical protein